MNIEELEAKVQALEKKVGILEDIDAIKRLHRIYSYYVMYMLKDEIVDCFADHPDTALYWIEGSWFGKEGVKRYFGVGADRPDPDPTFTHQVMPIAGVVDVEGNRGHGRWYAFGGVNIPRRDPSGGEMKSSGSFVGGIYEIEYIKQDGVWKFLTVKWIINYTAQLPENSWRYPEDIGRFVQPSASEAEMPMMSVPDIPPILNDPRFISGYIYPFHFDHPVTGKPTSEKARNLRTITAAKKARSKGQKDKKGS